MEFDAFFAISQTPVQGRLPSERQMFESFFRQVECADALGFGTAWVAESHLSSEVQKSNRDPVIPHWRGEVGLNVDITQLAHHAFRRTKRIEVGAAVMNILVNGGPIAAAERIAYAIALHGLDPSEKRRLHVGFAAGRFDFSNRASGICARDAIEQAAGPVLKGKIFAEATEIFLRLLRGDVLLSDDVTPPSLTRDDFRSDDDWQRVRRAAQCSGDRIDDRINLSRRWTFERIKIVPQDWRRELLQPVIGSHDAKLQVSANTIMPVHVFNLSITSPAQIEATHARMQRAFHKDGGAWKRRYMPRTTFVFLDDDRGKAQQAAQQALSAYWLALDGTVDPNKVAGAADNALIGDADDVADQIVARFHPDERLMLWFDFFNHDCDRVIDEMTAFMREVPARIAERLRA